MSTDQMTDAEPMRDFTGTLTPYTELAQVVGHLPILLREARRARGLSLRDVGSQLDISFSTICRIEQGEDFTVSKALAILKWLDQRTSTTREPSHA